MKRRDFIGLLCGTVTWPLATRAQGGMPVVGYLSSFSPETNRKLTEASARALRRQVFERGATSTLNIVGPKKVITRHYRPWQPSWQIDECL